MEHRNVVLRLVSLIFIFSYLVYFLNSIRLVIASTDTTTFSGFTNETDRRALIAIKDLIPGDPFSVFSSWNNSLHFCYWQGITCSLRHQRVTMLNLPSLSLAGSLSPHIGNLTFLQTIHLEHNSFHGTIPQELGRLFRLQNLFLANNSFQGEFPINLTHCSSIQVIDLSRNDLVGTLPNELNSLSSLLGLRLFRNSFTGTVPRSFGNFSTLRVLFLSENYLQGTIPFELGWLSNLELINLSSNNLSGIVPMPLFNISSIIVFSVAANRQLCGTLPPDLGLTLPELRAFYFGGNQFSGHFPETLANASRLVNFYISWNAFTGPVPMNLGSLRDLEELGFVRNMIGTNRGNDWRFIDSLTNCTNLRELNLNVNLLRGPLPDSIANLSTKLTALRLGVNLISGNIPHGIGNLVNLGSLSLHFNRLTGGIPDSIGKLSKLQALFLYANNISGNIPASIGNMTHISFIAIFSTMLEGTIPDDLGNCKNLQSLDLSENFLTGVIPEKIIGLSSLTDLLFYGNYLEGPLPFQVGNLRNVRQLMLSRNKFSGEIPSTLGACLSLEFLGLAENNFEGPIPSSLGNLRGLQAMDLYRNNFSGPIPSFLGEFSFLWYLNLSFNMFEGEVPNKGIFKNVSEFSIFGNNKLCGGIEPLKLPPCPKKVSKKQGNDHTRRTTILATSIPLSIGLLLACFCAIIYRSRKLKKRPSLDFEMQNQYPNLSYAELQESTNGFSLENLIGEGRYGSVYKGVLNTDEQTVAVKVLKLQEHGAHKSFLSECQALRNIRHRNLVKIITCCSSIDFKGNEFKALVFELMPNGSLERWLYQRVSDLEEMDQKKLNMMVRINIAIDVASALDYLHHHCESPIIHCDLKPSNVLLDDELCAHVGDFGLARFILATPDASNHTQSSSSTGIRGTVGYVAPEYGMAGEVSTQGDVYSYGILLLEIFTGKSPTNNMFADGLNLHNYAKMVIPDRVMEIIDPLLVLEEEEEDDDDEVKSANEINISKIKECLISIFRIGVACYAELPRERMDIKDALVELHVIRNAFLER